MKKEAIDPGLLQHAILDTNGATCSNCARAVEHVGAKLAGIQTIEVDRENNSIHIDYDGRPETIQEIVSLVDRLGYTATPRA